MSGFTKLYRRVFKFILDQRFDPAKVDNNEFTIICNNCTAGIIYKSLNQKFLSPTINLYIPYPDYITFLQKLDSILSSEMTFAKKSRLFSYNVTYPLGILDGVEIHFIHYESEEFALRKWNERKVRINVNRLFVIGSDRDGCKADDIIQFENLPFKNKVFFSSKKVKDCPSLIHFEKYRNDYQIGDIIEKEEWLNRFDLIHWLNTGEIKRYYLKKYFFKALFE